MKTTECGTVPKVAYRQLTHNKTQKYIHVLTPCVVIMLIYFSVVCYTCINAVKVR